MLRLALRQLIRLWRVDLLVLIIFASGVVLADEDKLGDVKQKIRKDFPNVSQVRTDQFEGWLHAKENLIVLDARAPEEFAVSHIYGARPAPSIEKAIEQLVGVPSDQLIVTYCSVGYRSSELAQQLTGSGFINVHNLEGSIFEWANRGQPVYRGDERVQKVHPYNFWWGRYLNKELHAP